LFLTGSPLVVPHVSWFDIVSFLNSHSLCDGLAWFFHVFVQLVSSFVVVTRRRHVFFEFTQIRKKDKKNKEKKKEQIFISKQAPREKPQHYYPSFQSMMANKEIGVGKPRIIPHFIGGYQQS
jgi:hypothetical protein